MADEIPLGTCYGPGSVVGAIIGTLLITLALVGAAGLLYNIYWRSRKGKHLVLVTDVENPADQYAFDNPGFREATPIKQSLVDEKPSKFEKSWLGGWSPLHVFSTPRNDKQRSLDDSFINDSQLKVVSLKSHDFTGLGFSVCGNMRDGIFVKDLLHRGPAFESGSINPGDRIDSVCISFRHMVFEDALTILSYASPYEVQVQVEHSASSRPSTLLRNKRESSSNSSGDRIRHPFYRSQSIADLAEIGKNSGKRGNRSTSDKNRSSKLHDSNASDYPTLKLPTSTLEPRKDHSRLEKKSLDVVDGNETMNKLHKFGIKVLPVNLSPKPKEEPAPDHEHVTEVRVKGDEADGKDVKAKLSKGIQNIKEKINQNTLGRKKKDSASEVEVPLSKEVAAEEPAKVEIDVESIHCSNVPEEVARAGEMARTNRKSVTVDSLMTRRSVIDILAETSADLSNDGTKDKPKKSKGKAPAPPQVSKEGSFDADHEFYSDDVDEIKVEIEGPAIREEPRSIFEPLQLAEDSDSEVEHSLEPTCTQATVHHSPPLEDPEPGRKAASLGDLSRLEADSALSVTLERAVSLDLDASHGGKKRKAPPPPPEDFPSAFDEAPYHKEPRLEGYNTFQRRLKKSSDFGTLQDALHEGMDSDNDLRFSPEPFGNLNTLAASNIQEFSSWLAEVRKMPQSDGPGTITLSVNGETPVEEISSKGDVTLTVTTSPEPEDEVSVPDPNAASPTSFTSIPPESAYTFSVNGENLQETVRTVLVIPQPNSLEPTSLEPSSLELEEPFTTASDSTLLADEEEEIPPSLPSTPMPTTPSSSLTYITEIKVSTPSSEPTMTTSTPRNPKPQRKDLNESSKIPIRTMKSETGQKVLAAIQSLAAQDTSKNSPDGDYIKKVPSLFTKDENTPNVAGFYLKKTPPAVPPRRGDTNLSWGDDLPKERNAINGTPLHLQVQTSVNFPVKTSATKIVFESKEVNNEEF